MATTYTYTVITQHGEDRSERRSAPITGTDYDATESAALAYAEALRPDVDGSVCPNVDEAYAQRPNFSRHAYWLGNYYAAIFCTVTYG